MKIIKGSKGADESRTVTLRISEAVMKKIDEIAEENGLSRQKLIAAILEQVIDDKSFVLKID